jgi:hypothetical protein
MLTGGNATLSCGTRNISQILLHSEQFCEIVESSVIGWWPTTVKFPVVSDCRLEDQGSIPGTGKGLIL